MFRKRVYEMLKGRLVQMVEAALEDIFNEVLIMAEDLLTAEPRCNGQVEAGVALYVSQRETVSSYCIQQLPGNRHQVETQAAEVNPASNI